MAINGGQIISYLSLDTSKYVSGFNAAQAQAQQFSGNMRGIIQGIGVASKLATAAVTVPMTALLTSSAKASIGFESSFAGVRKTVDTTEKGYAALRKEIFEIGGKVPKLHSELNAIMESAGQLGVAEKNIGKFTRTIADLDVSTNLKGEQGAAMLAQYANVSGMALENIDRLGSVIVALGNNTATTELDITQMAQRIAGTARIVHMTEAETFGLSATMTSLGINAEAGGSAMSRTLQKMQRAVKDGGKPLENFANIAGVSSEKFKQIFTENSLNGLNLFVAGINRINSEGGNIYAALDEVDLSDIRVGDMLLRLAGAQKEIAKNTELANKAWRENTALAKEAKQRYETTESKIKIAKNRINEAAVTIGDSLLPFVAGAADGAAKLAKGFADMDEGSRNLILRIGGVAAIAGPALGILKGAIALMSGPGGIVIAAGLVGAALAKIGHGADLSVIEKAKGLFGDVALSAEEVKNIIQAGFPRPVINLEEVKNAASAADEARKSFFDLQAELEKKAYLVRFNLTSPEELAKTAKSYIEAADRSLVQEGVVINANILAHFGNDEKGREITGIVNKWVDSQKTELAAAGERLTKIILDNTFKNEADKEAAIQRGIEEIAEIRAKLQIVDTETTREALKYKYKSRGLDRESYEALTNEINKYIADEKHNAEEVWTNALKGIAAGKDKLSQEKYQKLIDATNEKYGQNLAEIDLKGASLVYDAVGVDRIQQARKYIEEMKKLREELEKDPESEFEIRSKPIVSEIADARTVAAREWGFLEPTYESLKKMKEELGQLSPEFEKMLDDLSLLKNFGELFKVDDKSLIEQLEKLKPDKESRKNSGKEDAAAYVSGQTDEMAASQVSLKNAYAPPDMRSAFGGAGENAANAFISRVRHKSDEASRASAVFGRAALRGLNSALEIHSPSRASQRAAGFFTTGFIGRVDADGNKADVSGRNFAKKAYDGLTQESAVQKGKFDRMNNFTMHYAAEPIRRAGGGLPKLRQEDRDYYKRVGAQRKSVTKHSTAGAEDYGMWMPFALPDRAYINALDSAREKMLALTGSHRAYYDETAQEKALKAIEDKWTKLIDAEVKGYEALSDAQKEKHGKVHAQRIEQMQKQQYEELNGLKRNYELQKRIAIDHLNVRAEALNAEYEKKRRSVSESDNAKTIADLEKRIRQTRSARERRELSEELDKFKRDLALEAENEILQGKLKGLNALKGAVGAGVIGLGSLIGDASLYVGAGLRNVQGADSDKIVSALMDLKESNRQSGGNTITVDLRGAVIRNEDDLQHVVEMIEQAGRSISRDIWRN